VQNSIVSQNDGANCVGPISDGGHDLVFGDTTCPGINADPQLVLPNASGRLPFVSTLQGSSPAIDAVPANAGCSTTDQRGVSRPQGPACDIGSYEWAPPSVSGAGASASEPTTSAVTAAVTANAQDTAVTVNYGPTSAYRSTTASRDVGSATTAAATTFPLTGLVPGRTYHARLVATNGDGTTRTGDLTFTTPLPGWGGAGGGGAGGAGSGGTGSTGGTRGSGPPVIGNLRQSAPRWRAGSAVASISVRRPRRLPIGTTFSFTLNEPARVTFTFTQSRPGRRVAGRCATPTRSNANRHTCTRTVFAGTLTWGARAGADAVHFAGRLPSRRRLRAGTYTLVVVAVSAAGRRSSPRTLRFTIVR
jgi:hypothetical protein